MSVSSAIIMGLIQGIAEFLPISSSGHLAIAQHILGAQGVSEIPDFFDVLLHLGTLCAVFVAYWQEILDMVLEFFRGVDDLVHHARPARIPPARRLIWLLVFASLPLFAVLPVKERIESLSDNMYFVGGALLVTGVLLRLCDRVHSGRKNEKSASVGDVVVVGIAQLLATCPGISRSGMTITAGCFMGFERSFAVRFSFLLSIPAVIAANFLALLDVIREGVDWSSVPVYLIGVAVSAVSGYLSIRLIRYLADRGRFGVFAYYCWLVGAVTLVLTVVKG